MDITRIIKECTSRWDIIVRAAQKKGTPDAFYPVTLPNVDDHRFIDPTSQAIPPIIGLYRAKIANPLEGGFVGFILAEQQTMQIGPDYSVVNVTYLGREGIKQVQCIKEVLLKDDKATDFRKYLVISVATNQTKNVEDAVQKVYNTICALIQE